LVVTRAIGATPRPYIPRSSAVSETMSMSVC
jgi:hypothetical protein